MDVHSADRGPPQRILLATDLNNALDRPLGRAALPAIPGGVLLVRVMRQVP